MQSVSRRWASCELGRLRWMHRVSSVCFGNTHRHLYRWFMHQNFPAFTKLIIYLRLLYTNIPHMCKADMWLPEKCTHRRPSQLVKLFNRHLTGDYIVHLCLVCWNWCLVITNLGGNSLFWMWFQPMFQLCHHCVCLYVVDTSLCVWWPLQQPEPK